MKGTVRSSRVRQNRYGKGKFHPRTDHEGQEGE